MTWNLMMQPTKAFARVMRRGSGEDDDEWSTTNVETRNRLHREQILLLDRLINTKVSNLVSSMEEKTISVPLNVRKHTADNKVPIIIYGNNLVSWFITNMGIAPNEAMYLANLLGSHPVLHSITNHYLYLLNFGMFERYPVSRSRNANSTAMEIDAVNDYEYMSYLCLRSVRVNLHGGTDGYEIDDSAKLYVDLTKWKFEFMQSSL